MFIENLELPIHHGNYDGYDNTDLQWTNFIGYNDSKHILFFIGFYISDYDNQYGEYINSEEVFIYDLERYLSKYLELF